MFSLLRIGNNHLLQVTDNIAMAGDLTQCLRPQFLHPIMAAGLFVLGTSFSLTLLCIKISGDHGGTVAKVLCYTNRKVAGSILTGVIGIFH